MMTQSYGDNVSLTFSRESAQKIFMDALAKYISEGNIISADNCRGFTGAVSGVYIVGSDTPKDYADGIEPGKNYVNQDRS